jgi:branched-chain amino acid transport system substrate-binding protein
LSGRQPQLHLQGHATGRREAKRNIRNNAMKRPIRSAAVAVICLAASMLAATGAAADLRVGFITSLSGRFFAGDPVRKGSAGGDCYRSEVDGRRVQVVQLDDASDPSTAARNARKLIDEDKVDVVIGTAGSPGALAIAAVAGR